MTAPDFNDRNVRAGIVAHAIRLGKRPDPGMVLGFSVQVKESADPAILKGDLSSARNVGEKTNVEFVVTAADIANAIQLINAQLITYREPHLSIMPLNRKE